MERKEQIKQIMESLSLTKKAVLLTRENAIKINDELKAKMIDISVYENQLKEINRKTKEYSTELEKLQKEEYNSFSDRTRELLKMAKEAYKMQVANIKAEDMKLKQIGA